MKRYEEKEVKWLIGKPKGLFLTRRSGTLRLAGVGAIIAGIWFIADIGTMGVNYLRNGEAKGLGDMIDDAVGHPLLEAKDLGIDYDGLY